MRSKISLAVVLLGSLAVLLADVACAEAGSDAPVYELRMGTKRFRVTPGETFEIKVPHSARLAAVLRYAPRVFSKHGVRFEHPHDMKIESHVTPGGSVIRATRGGQDTIVSLLIGPPDPEPLSDVLAGVSRKVRSDMERAFRTQVTETPVRAEIAGATHTGVRLTGVDLDDPIRIDAYVLPLADRGLWITFRHLRSQEDEAARAFRTIVGSLAAVGGDEALPAPRAAFELHVGDRSYPVDVDQAFRIEDSKGKKRRAVLVPGRKTYTGFGMQFVHPGDTKVRANKLSDALVKITVENGTDYQVGFTVWLSADVPLAGSRDLGIASVMSSVEKRTGLKFEPPRPCKRTFLGRRSEGRKASTIGDGERYHVEVHSIKISERTVSIRFHWEESKREIAERAFKQIASTLKESD